MLKKLTFAVLQLRSLDLSFVAILAEAIDEVIGRLVAAIRALMHRTCRSLISHAKAHIGISCAGTAAILQGVDGLGDIQSELLTSRQLTWL